MKSKANPNPLANLNKQEKVSLLKKILRGEKMEQVLFDLSVMFMEGFTKNRLVVFVGMQVINWALPPEQQEQCLQQIKAEYPYQNIIVTYMPREEYDRISQALEEEY